MNEILQSVMNQTINDFDDIREAIEYLGIPVPIGTPTSKYEELIRSIIIGGNKFIRIEIFPIYSSGSWTVPPGCYMIDVAMVGGGSGMSNTPIDTIPSGNSYSGGNVIRQYGIPVTPGNTYTCTIGQGGIGGAGSGGGTINSPSPGGNTTFMEYVALGGLQPSSEKVFNNYLWNNNAGEKICGTYSNYEFGAAQDRYTAISSGGAGFNAPDNKGGVGGRPTSTSFAGGRGGSGYIEIIAYFIPILFFINSLPKLLGVDYNVTTDGIIEANKIIM